MWRQSAANVARENVKERELERAVERRVNDWVDDWWRVAEPEERVEEPGVDVAWPTDADDEVDDEERRPAGDERREHRSDDTHGLSLRPHHRARRAVWRPSGSSGSPTGTAWYWRRHAG